VRARILVVDDEPDLESLVRQRFRRQVRDGELEFLFARDGEEALGVLAADGPVDLVLSDINMPRMDGLTLLERLKQLHEHLMTVIVSAYGDMANIRTAMNRGAFDFVTKPIDFDDLATTIRKTLTHLEMMREAERRRVEAERAQAVLARYFSPNLAQKLASEGTVLALGGERREVTSLFTDLTNFTTLVETLGTSVIVPLVNDYLTGITGIAFEHQGTVVKIVGDAVHILFGAPLEQPDQAARAVACALAIDAFAEAFRAAKQDDGIPLGVTRIGINAGSAIVGNFGGEQYFDYTAYGDAINIAARLERANKVLGTRICASRSVAAQVPGFSGRPVGDLLLRGRTGPLRAYEPLSQARSEDPAVRAYCEAFARLEAGDPTAAQAFAAVIGTHGPDPLVTFHLKRLLGGEAGTRLVLHSTNPAMS
jgi:adenylate cyclase